MLALSSEYGTNADCGKILQLMKSNGIPLAACTFNVLLNRCVKEGNKGQATAILTKMSQEGIAPDTFTYHTLLKLYVQQNDQIAIEKVRWNQCRSVPCFYFLLCVLSDFARNGSK